MHKYLEMAIQSTKSLKSKMRQSRNMKENQTEDILFSRTMNDLYSTHHTQKN